MDVSFNIIINHVNRKRLNITFYEYCMSVLPLLSALRVTVLENWDLKNSSIFGITSRGGRYKPHSFLIYYTTFYIKCYVRLTFCLH